MQTPVASILRTAGRRPNEALNILGWSTHERTQTNIAKTRHNFYCLQGNGFKVWEPKYAPVPPNFFLCDPSKPVEVQLPKHVDFDLILAETRFGQAQLGLQLARRFHLPLIILEHTTTSPEWPQAYLTGLKQFKGDINLFITKWSRASWLWKEDEAEVIYHGVDTDTFCPDGSVDVKPLVLSICNDWINRDWCCGFNLWKEVSAGLPTHVVGATPGLSEPASSIEELVKFYREAQVFLNTSLRSPIPTVCLEAASCGTAIVSTANCAITEFFTHGHDALLSDDPKELRKYTQTLLSDPVECERLGKNARKTIKERFSLERFINDWDIIFRRAARMPYTGNYN